MTEEKKPDAEENTGEEEKRGGEIKPDTEKHDEDSHGEEEDRITPGQKVMIAILAVVIVMALIEGVLRCIEAVKPHGPVPESRRYLEPDTALGWVNVRNFNEDGISINSLGYRNREFSPVKDRDVFRIVCMGDTAIFGDTIKGEENTIPGLLERDLAATGKHIQVINAAVTGHASCNVLYKLQHDILPLEPDMIIIYTGWSDLCLIDPEVVSGAPSRNRGVLEGFETARALGKLMKGSKSQDSLPKSYSDFIPAKFMDYLAVIADTARQRRIPCLFCTVPALLYENRSEDDLGKIKYPYFTKDIKALQLLHGKYNDGIRKVAADFGMPLIDLDREITGREYFSSESLPNVEGNKKIAEILARAVQASAAKQGAKPGASPAPLPGASPMPGK